MTKEVLISVKGLQFEIDEDEAVEVISVGEYYYRNGKHYIMYEELLPNEDGRNELTKNTIKISDQQIDIIKKGVSNVHMIFELNKKNMTFYNTPFGDLLIGLNTTYINVNSSGDNLDVKLEYALDVNYSHVSDCEIKINVKSK